MIGIEEEEVIYAKGKNSYIIQMENETGDGSMILYSIMPGIKVSFNNYHMKKISSNYNSEHDIFTIEYCKEGRLEWERKGKYGFIGTGELYAAMHEKNGGKFEMPTSNYKGISIILEKPCMDKKAEELLDFFDIDLGQIIEKYCKTENPILIKKDEKIEEIVDKLYLFRYADDNSYRKLKTIELLVYLNKYNIDENYNSCKYFIKDQVKTIEEIKKFIISNCDKHYTLKELSEKFDISLSIMKRCFKEVFGDSIYSYLKVYRINMAARLLKETDYKIDEIAYKVGYENSSKFAAAFKKIMGKSPRIYRNL